MVQIEAWMETMKERLFDIFGKRVLFLGLQGSYRRQEADENSDIDVMVVLDRLSINDLTAYRQLVSEMEEGEKACGFICGRRELAAWPAYEIFHLLHDTRPYFGVLADLVPEIGLDDIRSFVRIGTANLYHMLCHCYLYSGREEQKEILKGLYKTTFFILENKSYLDTGSFAGTKRELLEVLGGTDYEVLKTAGELKARPESGADYDAAFRLLFGWCQSVLREMDA